MRALNIELFKRAVFYLALMLLFKSAFATDLTVARDKNEIKRILYISSYSPDFKNFFHQVEGIKSEFDSKEVTLDIEFMDSKRFYTEENLENFRRSLEYKISRLPEYDGVIIGDDNALNFAMENKAELFPETPVVFMGVNNFTNGKRAAEDPYVTGVLEAPSISDTIELALKINPRARQLVAISDNSNSGKGDLEAFYLKQSEFQNVYFRDIDLSEMSFTEAESKIRKLDDDDIIILLSLFRDAEDDILSFEEGVNLVMSNTDLPIYYPYVSESESGVLGGKVVSHFEQGKRAAQILTGILNGKEITSEAIHDESLNKYVFDYNAMQKYGIDENILPRDSIFLYKKVSYFEEYKYQILGLTGILLLQFMIIMLLQINIIKRKKAEKKLLKSRADILDSNMKLKSLNEDLVASNKKINELIYYDPLTGLDNRLSISSKIDELILRENLSSEINILFLGIDNFKNVNDTYGHEIGDKVIIGVVDILRKFESDFIELGRFGGDEFIYIIRKDVDHSYILRMTENIKQAFLSPIVIDNINFFLTFSMGVATYPDDARNRMELVKKADLALYKAKLVGKNNCVFYSNQIDNELQEKVFFQDAVKKATLNREFYLNYQPYIDSDKEIIGVEALIRWESKEYGYVSPYKLIRNLEEMGLIIKVGNWILREAMCFAKKINANREKKIKVSINISAIQFMSEGFFDDVMKIVETYGIDSKLICLEVTETVLIESLEMGNGVINKLRGKGFEIALDDFGTGYSSLQYFKKLSLDILKIDKSFVDNIASDEHDQKFIGTMISIAKDKGIRVTAEGVEKNEQLEILHLLGCDNIQGFFVSKPLKTEEIEKVLKT